MADRKKLIDELEWFKRSLHALTLRDTPEAERAALHTRCWQALHEAIVALDSPVPLRLPCPECHELHVDEGDFATHHHHHTHACQACGHVWRPAVVNTVGVRFLPGFKNEEVPNG